MKIIYRKQNPNFLRITFILFLASFSTFTAFSQQKVISADTLSTRFSEKSSLIKKGDNFSDILLKDDLLKNDLLKDNLEKNCKSLMSENLISENNSIQNLNIGFNKETSIELIDKRTSNSRTFKNIDGSYSVQQSSTPVFYRNLSGNWVEYSSVLSRNSENSDLYEISDTDLPISVDVTNGKTKMYLDNSNSMEFGYNSELILTDANWNVINKSISNQDFSNSLENQTVILKNFFNNIDRKQNFEYWNIETDYIINSKPEFINNEAYLIFKDRIDLPENWKIVKNEGIETDEGWVGNLLITDEKGNPKGSFYPLSFYDSSNDLSQNNSNIQGAYKIDNINGDIFVSVIVPVSWLLDENRVYPVIIDPTVTNTLVTVVNSTGPTGYCSTNGALSVVVPAGGVVFSTDLSWTFTTSVGNRYQQVSYVSGPNGNTPVQAGNLSGAGNQTYTVNGTTIGNSTSTGSVTFTWFAGNNAYTQTCSAVNHSITSRTATVTYNLTFYSKNGQPAQTPASWNTARDGSGTNAVAGDFTSGNIFVVQTGHTMTTTAVWSIDGTGSKLQIESGGTLRANNAITLAVTTPTTFQIDDGGTYIHNNNNASATTIFHGTESFATTSTVDIRNWDFAGSPVTSGLNTSPVNGYNYFGNLTININSATNWPQTWTGAIYLCANNFSFANANTGVFRMAAAGIPDVYIEGNYIQTSGIVDLSTGVTGQTYVYISGDFNKTGGIIRNSTTHASNYGYIFFNGTLNQNIRQNSCTSRRIIYQIQSGSQCTLTGDFFLEDGTNPIGFFVTDGGTLTCNNLLIRGSNAGSLFSLGAGATLGIGHAQGISLTGATGNVQISGTRSYDADGIYIYNGSAAQVTGLGLTSARDLIINNTTGVTLSGPVTVNEELEFQNGKLTLGTNNLTMDPYASIIGYDATKYIVTNSTGYLIQYADENWGDVFYPIGIATTYNPLTLNNTGTWDYFGVRVSSTISNPTNDNTRIVNRQWTLNETTAGGSNLTLTYQWNAPGDQAASFNPANPLKAGLWTGAAYEAFSASNGGANPIYTATASMISNTLANTPFVVGNDAAFTTPTITVCPVSLTFPATNVGSNSAEQSYIVKGINLTGNITITPPVGFQISLTSGAGFISNPATLTLSPTGGIVNPTTIYVRFAPTGTGTISVNIQNSSAGATLKNVAVTGYGVRVYYSNNSAANFNTLTGWGVNADGSGANPAALNNSVYLIANHNKTTSAAVTVGCLEINSGATVTAANNFPITIGSEFKINSGGTYIHDNTGVIATTIFNGTETFSKASTFEIRRWETLTTSITNNLTASIPIDGANYYFGNLTINYTTMVAGNVFSPGIPDSYLCAGNLTITSTGAYGGTLATSGCFRISAAAAGPTVVVLGNYTQANSTYVDFNNNAAQTANTNMLLGGNYSLGTPCVLNNSGALFAEIDFIKASGTQTISVGALAIQQWMIWNIGNGSTTNTVQMITDVNDATNRRVSSITINENSTLDLNGRIVRLGGSTSGTFDVYGTLNATVANSRVLLGGTANRFLAGGTVNGSELILECNTTGTNTLYYDVSIKNLVITAGTFSLNGYTLGITGTYTNTGTLNGSLSTSELEFKGSALQNFTVGTYTSSVLGKLIINNPAGVTLGAPVSLYYLNLSNGILNTTAANFPTISTYSTSSITGGSEVSFVNGSLAKAMWGNISTDGTNYFLPVGEGTNYRPVELLNVRTGATGPVVKVTCDGAGATTPDGTTLGYIANPRNWDCSIIGAGNFTSATLRISENGLGEGTRIGMSNALAGNYSSIGGTVVNNTISSNEQAFTLPATPTIRYYAIGVINNPNSKLSDIVVKAGYTYQTNIPYINYQSPDIIYDANSIEVAAFTIRDEAAAGDALGTTLNQITFNISNSSNIRRVALYDGTTELGEVDGAASVTFTGLNITTTDGGTKDFQLRVSFNTSVTDNQNFQFTVAATTFASITGSGFATTNAGGAVSSVAGDNNKIEVTATQLTFTAQPSATEVSGAPLVQQPVLKAQDALKNTDLDFTGAGNTVTLANTASFVMANNTAAPLNGIVTLVNLTHTGNGYTSLSAAGGGISSIENSDKILVGNLTYCTILSETFESASTGIVTTAGLSGWKAVDFDASVNVWSITNTATPITGTKCLTVSNPVAYNYNGSDDCEKIVYYSTLIDATNYENLKMDFNYKCWGETNYDYGMVYYSTDGNIWTAVSSTKYAAGNNTTQNVLNLDLSALDKKEFYIGFYWNNDGDRAFNQPFAVDDIVIKGTPAPADYLFSYNYGTFSPITGTISTASGNDGFQDINIFNFSFYGTTYSKVRISMNGWVEFFNGATPPYTGNATVNDFTDHATYSIPLLAPLWDDLIGDASTTITYTTSGTSPNREFTIQWEGVQWRNSLSRQNFQVKLFETTNVIHFVYGTMNTPAGGGTAASIGISDGSFCQNRFISVTPGATPTKSNYTSNNTINSVSYLTSGLTYIFGPSTMQTYDSWIEATYVIGQSDFYTRSMVVNQATGVGSNNSAVSSKGVLAVGAQGYDMSNPFGRVLIYNSVPSSDGALADAVIGKTSWTDDIAGCSQVRMYDAEGVAFSPDGNKLIVSDGLNNRVLIWNSIPTGIGQPADVVIGQTDFTSSSSGCAANKLKYPAGIIVTPSGKLIINDMMNNRVLIYNSIPTSNGASANVVIGQSNMTTSTAGTTASKLNTSWYSSFSPDGKLLIADGGNNRVLIFNTLPTSNGASADYVIGQTDFTTNTTGCTSSKFDGVVGVTVSPEGKVAIGDGYNNRVLIYNSIPNENGAIADIVLGQPNFTENVRFNDGLGNSGTPDKRNMRLPYGINFDLNGRLIVNGRDMHRAMLYGVVPPDIADLGISFDSDVSSQCMGADVVYSLIVTNYGPDLATSIVITSALPVGFTLQSFSTTSGSYNSSSGFWTIPALPVGTSATLTFVGNVNTGTGSTSIVAYANILSSLQQDDDMTNNAASKTVTIYNNSVPTISVIADQNIARGATAGPLAFTIGDAETSVGTLIVTGTSSNTALVPDGNITFGGSGANRTVTVTPLNNQVVGTTTITLTITDAPCFTSETFILVIGNVWQGDDVTNPTYWDDADNWSIGVPSNVREALIPTYPIGGVFPVVRLAGATCGYLDIEAGASVTINNTFTLNVTNSGGMSGNIIIHSDASQTGSLVDLTANGNALTVSGSVQVERYITAGGWHYISSPLNNISNKVVTEQLNCYSYNRNLIRYNEAFIDDGTHDWMLGWEWPFYTPNTNSLEVSRGYAAYIDASCDNTIDFIGAIAQTTNSGNYSYPVTYTDRPLIANQFEGWNLIGNPYPSGVDALDFMATNSAVIDGFVYFWGKPGSSGFIPSDYAWFSSLGSSFVGSTGEIPDKYISSGQAFFVHKTVVGSGNITFTNAMREMENSYFYKSPEDEIIQKLWFSVTNNQNMYNDILIAFVDDATDTIDSQYDGLKMEGNPNLALYSIIDNFNYVVQALAKMNKGESKSVTLGIHCGLSGTYNFKLNDIENIPDWIQIYFEDTLYSNFVNLRKTNNYAFTSVGNERIENRFKIHFVTNNPPFVVNSISDKVLFEDQSFSFVIEDNIFDDPDIGDVLTYSIKLQNDEPVPAWLNFNSNTKKFTGTPGNEDVGSLQVKLIATDICNESESTSFTIFVNNTNDAPYVANSIEKKSVNEDEVSIISIPENTFVDMDTDDYLTLSVSVNYGILPDWASFNQENNQLEITAGNYDVGLYTFKVIATDMEGATAETDFMLEVVNVNDPPYIVNPILDFNLKVNDIFTLQINNLIFSDIDVNDSLEYSFSLLPAWLSFDSNLNLLFGIPSSNDVGAYNLSVTANDLAEESVAESFNVFVEDLVGIFETESMVMVYPNPSDGLYIVKINENKINLISYSVVDITGKKIITGNTDNNAFIVDLRNYSSGVYFLEISVDNQVFTKKLIMN